MRAFWRIEMLGTLRAVGEERIVSRFQTQQTASLLAYLATHPQRDALREELIDLLWPEAEIPVGRSRLSQAVWAIRRQLEPAGIEAGSVLLANRNAIRLNPEAIVTDTQEFQAATREASHRSDPSARLSRLEAAIALYKGPFLPMHYDDWVYAERQALHDMYLGNVRQAAKLHRQLGNVGAAIGHLQRLVAQDPLQEDLHIELMRLYSEVGRLSDVQRQYEELATVLQDQLGEEPSGEAMELVRRTPKAGAPSLRPAPRSAVVPEVAEVREGRATRLPFPLTHFFGRERELGTIEELFAEEGRRLVTLVGIGGCGKTRLGLEAAGRLTSRFGSSLWFVPLADLHTIDEVEQAILEALHVKRSDGLAGIVNVLNLRLAEGRGLLLLDNLEHLPEEVSGLVRRMLDGVPNLEILATSRRRLQLDGEADLAVEPLPVQEGVPLEELMRNPAIRLFVDRAQLVRANFQLTPRNAEAICELCRRLEGIPLAIELAAAQVHMLSPMQINKHIGGRFDLLVSRRKDIPARHRTLRAATDYSYLLLSEPLQKFFAALSVFSGGWTLEAAQAVCLPDESLGLTFDRLSELHDRSMIYAEETPSGMRYRMLETLREYAFEKLDASARDVLFLRHLRTFARLADVPDPAGGPWQTEWLAHLEAERENIRAALTRGQALDPASALRFAVGLEFYWEVKGLLAEGIRSLEALLGERIPDELRPAGHNVVGRLYWLRGDFARSAEYFGLALEESLAGGDAAQVRLSRQNLATARYRMVQLDGLVAEVEENLADAESAGDVPIVIRSHMLLGNFALDRHAMGEAREHYDRALHGAQQIQAEYSVLGILSNIGLTYFNVGDYRRAKRYWTRTLAMADHLRERMRRSTNLLNLGQAAYRLNDYVTAREYCVEALHESVEIGSMFAIVECLETFADLAIHEGQRVRAARLFGAATHLREQLRVPLARDGSGQEPKEFQVLREELGRENFEAEWREGQSMDVAEITAYALER